MSEYLEAVVVGEENDFKKLYELIPIRCIECGKKEGLASLAAQTKNLDQDKRERRVIIKVCKEHANKNTWLSDNHVNYKLREKEIACQLKDVKQTDSNKPIQLNNANQTLDKNACCMRENLKLVNLMTLFTLLSLVSNDNCVIRELVQNLLTQQYFQFQELQGQFKEASKKGNVLQGLILNNKLNTFKRTFLQQCDKNIIDTLIFNPNQSTGQLLSLSKIISLQHARQGIEDM